jgi:hypothetical protein
LLDVVRTLAVGHSFGGKRVFWQVTAGAAVGDNQCMGWHQLLATANNRRIVACGGAPDNSQHRENNEISRIFHSSAV